MRIPGPWTSQLASGLATAFAVVVLCTACGKKGPPLAPLNMAPEAPKGVEARRLGDTVYLRLTVPDTNASGTRPLSLDHLEVYAVTLAPDTPAPANRYLLKPQFVVGRIAVRPPVDPDAETPAKSEADTRPKPGDVATFVEKLTPEVLVPKQIAPPPAAPRSVTVVPTPPPTTAPAAPAVLSRLYVVQGVARNGSKGAPSARISVPLLAAPAPARPGTTSYDANSVTVSWQPPASRSDEAPGVTYNIYSAAAAGSGGAVAAPLPLNDAPLTTTTFSRQGAAPGQEQCFVVRSVAAVGTATIESDPSEPICVTPQDTFPPAAPKGLAAVSGAGVVNLIWDANTDADLGGYLVLRGEAPGDTLQPLTAEPIRETRYADRSVQAGVTYVYAVVAVDRASPPNRSALSNKVQETAR